MLLPDEARSLRSTSTACRGLSRTAPRAHGFRPSPHSQFSSTGVRLWRYAQSACGMREAANCGGLPLPSLSKNRRQEQEKYSRPSKDSGAKDSRAAFGARGTVWQRRNLVSVSSWVGSGVYCQAARNDIEFINRKCALSIHNCLLLFKPTELSAFFGRKKQRCAFNGCVIWITRSRGDHSE